MTDEQILNVLADQLIHIMDTIKEKQTRYVFTTICEVKNNKYYGYIDGAKCELPNGTNITFKTASPIIVCIPNNDFKKKFIIAKHER